MVDEREELEETQDSQRPYAHQPEQTVVVPFGEGLRRRRMVLNISQTDVARMIGVAPSTITKYETRMRPPRDNYLVDKLARIYNTTRADLLAGKIPLSMIGIPDMVSFGQTATRAIMPAQPYAVAQEQQRVAHEAREALEPREGHERMEATLPQGGEDVLAEGEVGEIIADVLALEVLAPDHIPTIAALVRGLRRLAERGEL